MCIDKVPNSINEFVFLQALLSYIFKKIMEQAILDSMLEEKGFIDKPIRTDIILADEINKLRREKNAVILSHFYVDGALQDIADYVGDSLRVTTGSSKN